MANQKIWTKEEILKLWPQAKGKLRGFQRHLEAKSGLTAAQLGMAIQLAEAEYKRLLPKVCDNCKKETDTIKTVEKIVDRFEVAKVKVCPKCAEKIRKENSMFSN